MDTHSNSQRWEFAIRRVIPPPTKIDAATMVPRRAPRYDGTMAIKGRLAGLVILSSLASCRSVPFQASPFSRPHAAASAPAVYAEWRGAKLLPASPALNAFFHLPKDATGVVVAAIQPRSLAEAMGLQVGDLILAVDLRQSPDLKSFLTLAAAADIVDGVTLDINREGTPLYLTIRKTLKNFFL
jgi:hypothetical protein